MIFCGLVGATIAGVIIDYTKKYKEVAVVTLSLALLCFVWFTEVIYQISRKCAELVCSHYLHAFEVKIGWEFHFQSCLFGEGSKFHPVFKPALIVVLPSQVSSLIGQSVNVAFSLCFFGFFALPLIPACMELGVEITYPVAEATSSGLLWSAV